MVGKLTFLAFMSGVAALPAVAAECQAPRFSVFDLIAVDDGQDRGYPGGVSLVDADGDGDLDVMATRGYDPTAKEYRGDRSVLYLNDGTARFTRQADPFSGGDAHDSPDSGSTWADVDGDGDLDAFVSVQLGVPDLFYRNLGGGKFERAELGEATTTRGSNFTSSWADIDGDDDLDLLVGGPTLSRGEEMLVFRNDAGEFKRVIGNPIENGKNNPGAVLWADIDNDGDQDLVVANSEIQRASNIAPAPVEHPVVYRNEGNWNFVAVEGQAFADPAYGAVTAALGDIDNDGDLDLFIGRYQSGGGSLSRDSLFLNDGAGVFSLLDVELAEHDQLATGAAFADFNLDGALDLVFTSYNSPIVLYLGDGAGGFAKVESPELAGRVKSHWGLATGDLNGDGRIDAVIGDWGETAAGEYVTVMLNETAPCGGFVELLLEDRNGAPNPPGARVTLVSKRETGVRRQLREASAQTGFRSQSASFFLFSVPKGEKIQHAEIRWPDGRTEVVKRVKPNTRRTVSDE